MFISHVTVTARVQIFVSLSNGKSIRTGARSIFSGETPIQSVSAHKEFPQAFEGIVWLGCYFVFLLRCLLTPFDIPRYHVAPHISVDRPFRHAWFRSTDHTHFPLFFRSHRSRPLHLAYSTEHTAHTILSRFACDSFYRRGNMRTLNDILRFNPVVVFKASRRTHVSAT